MNKRTRLIFLILSTAILVGLGYCLKGDLKFLLDDFWFTSGVLLLILLSLIDQPHFSKDSNIFVNAITGAISLLILEAYKRDGMFWFFLISCGYLAISSLVIMWLRDKPLVNENKTVQFVSRLNRQIGRPEAIFSAFFLWGALDQFGASSKEFNSLLLFWIIFMILNIPAIATTISRLFEPNQNERLEHSLGKIFSVQSKNSFLIKLFVEKKNAVSEFDFVEFKFSGDKKDITRKGFVLESFVLNEEKWIKVLCDNLITNSFKKNNIYSEHLENIVYRITDEPINDFRDRFVGLVEENSKIGVLRFLYNPRNSVQEGQLLEIKAGDDLVYYQIVEGITKIESLEQKNESGFVIGEAVQLGVWDKEKTQFEKFGWVPSINIPVLMASPIEEIDLDKGELKIGGIPDSNFPVILNKELSLTHHTAVLGVTGTGKSVFSRNLIREHLKEKDVKVICIDFTGEYRKKFADLNPLKILEPEKEEKLFQTFDWVSSELEKYGNQQDKSNLKKADESVKSTLTEGLAAFLSSQESNITIFELPDVSNTHGILEYTRQMFRALFSLAKENKTNGNKICIVLEEAHTIIPEWNFVGIADKSSQSLLNSIAQIALQGRKYNVGLLVIAQRTANVSKTVLTQCNTIISFQEFDKTSSDFLANYFGQGIAETLPNLKFRQAIAAGKAMKSNVPMIFEVPDIQEPEHTPPAIEEDDDLPF